ncbi:reverse transcriptase domain-containing protein [Tanacetum coccineum]
MRKKSDFRWTPEAEQAFKKLKQHISELPMLVAPRPKEELIMYLSASQGAVGAVLMTERDSIQMPIYFVSQALQGPELNYTPMEKLVLALVFAAKRLRRYFQAHLIAVIMDQPIRQVMSRPEGQILADFLVEKPEEASTNMSEKEAPQEPWTLFTDVSLCIDGLGAGLILTSPEGAEFTYALRFQFTASNNEAEYEALLVELRSGRGTSRKVHPRARGGGRGRGRRPNLDNTHNRVPERREAKAVATISGGHVKKFVWDNIVCRFGLPGKIVLENSKQFSDNPFKDWCEKLNITQRFASVKHPQSNGLVERANRSLGEGIKARLGEGNKNWIEEIPHVLWAHSTMIKSSNGDTPFSLTYGTEAVIPSEIGMPTYRTAAVDIVRNDDEIRLNLDLLEERRERAAICEAKAKSKMMRYYNARVRDVTFKPGDYVYRSNEVSHAMDEGKLGPKWEGTYEVTEVLGGGAYKLRAMDGAVLSQT